MTADRFKIGYFADGPWSHFAFEKLVSDPSIQIVFVVPRTDTTDETLEFLSKREGIPFIKEAKVNSEEFFNLAQSLYCDLFVSMSFNQIFKPTIIGLPKVGTINCHAGKLPFYRGRNILNWALINDEQEFGITVHYIDEGIDTGDIILQRVFPITDNDDYDTLLKTSYVECGEILFDAVKMIQTGDLSRTIQSDIHTIGFYCGVRKPGDEKLDWNQNTREIFNFIRSICYPGPKAQSFINGDIIKINKARLITEAPRYIGIVGQIVGKTIKGFVVKTRDSTIEIREIESKKELKIGDRFSNSW